MEQKNIKSSETRPVFRKLAGIIAALWFFTGLPASVYVALNGHWNVWLIVFVGLFGAIGFISIAMTGRWYYFRKGSKDA